jgi:hypothetical protein
MIMNQSSSILRPTPWNACTGRIVEIVDPFSMRAFHEDLWLAFGLALAFGFGFGAGLGS